MFFKHRNFRSDGSIDLVEDDSAISHNEDIKMNESLEDEEEKLVVDQVPIVQYSSSRNVMNNLKSDEDA